ncbi:2OG-Fe(II) oxygenase [Nocardia noduli]|uniref:2OG-Fe(II) oxygenase n=1 Tax=Nocardia noduli TaxID=2815722 RepID=UPI001C2339F2|nr:2OG-Fe(II) oxygenase [Nocardia noduli]
MTDQTSGAISELLDSTRPPGSFVAHGTAPAESLVIEVEGVGVLGWPVTPTQARQLCDIARPARYGLGEQTLLDPNVRDTWEVPRGRISVDQGRWHLTLGPVLDAVRTGLGLFSDSELSAELHSMLVYEPGQFFRRHQDSEKSDGMIGTLVVTLPSDFTGGELVVEHRGEKVSDRGSPGELGFLAFYADCHHEVLPVTEGFRISLTYNLIASGRAAASDDLVTAPATITTLAGHLREHFSTPIPVPTWLRDGGPASRPPKRLVYLLDHRYSQRGFGWDQLKGSDAARAGALVAASEHAECDVALALAEIHRTHACDLFEDEDWMYGRRRRWELVDGTWEIVDETWEPIEDEDEDFDYEVREGVLPVDHPERIETARLGDDFGSNAELTWWIDQSGNTGTPVEISVSDGEICAGTAESAHQMLATESAGYMGNEGDTIDRWYRRAAIVVQPRT